MVEALPYIGFLVGAVVLVYLLAPIILRNEIAEDEAARAQKEKS
jgi:hypothetical protein